MPNTVPPQIPALRGLAESAINIAIQSGASCKPGHEEFAEVMQLFKQAYYLGKANS